MMQKITFNKDQTKVTFLDSGDLFEITTDEIMVNQLHGNHLDGSLNQIYLRVYLDGKIQFAPLVGSNSASEFIVSENQLTWVGKFLSINYRVIFQLAESNTWFWAIELSGTGEFDIIYGQDMGNAMKGALQANESYMSQYLDHHVFKENNHIVISSRQNQPQNDKFPLIEQGSFQKLKSYSTDGYQFFGKKYKETNLPEVLDKVELENQVYQYEFAYTALQTEVQTLENQELQFVFYVAVNTSQELAVVKPVFSVKTIQERYDQLDFSEVSKGNTFKKNIGTPVTGKTFSEQELANRFPIQNQIEKISGSKYSFFTEENRHVVLKAKETEMERAHGHIILSGQDLSVERPLMSTTVYMYGVFNSQVVLGNTSMNKLMSNTRNMLNTIKISGQRIYLLEEGQWRILTMPSAFEMGLNSARWYYKLDDDVIVVTTYSVNETREVRTEIQSEKGKSYTWAITNQFLMGPDDQPNYQLSREANCLILKSKQNSVVNKVYPELVYYLDSNQPFTLETGELFTNLEDDTLTILKIEDATNIELRIQGNLVEESYQHTQVTFEAAIEDYNVFISELLNDFELSHETADIQRMNIASKWYTHNMLVHYLSPHGLEQFGGAAWGTRDVSQGPSEFFLAVNRPDVVANIIYNLYTNQFENDGNWPQWFMFDRYETQKASESHGDVIVWPMKVVADYLTKTGDYSILDKKIPYTDRATFLKTETEFSLYHHIKKEISYIENHFLEGTYLSCYGDGDWDDTLQPYDERLKKHMASSWTVALTYQVLSKLANLLTEFDAEYSNHLDRIVVKIKNDYNKYILSSETIPGFVYMEDTENVELMIHPSDKKTGIQYRLLPMTRSMIAELFTPEQVQHHLEIIREQLTFPDGVRLMNRPAFYAGGVSTNFKRAEQAANFGREVGLQYVHAHIRYAEAMAKIGQTNEAWNALQIINPIQIKNYVSNSELRQANVYFSSSDGDFKTRYEAQENFGKLREGNVNVKGGWRIYSSGPGIYLNQLITNVLGIREDAKTIVLDPILPQSLDGLRMEYKIFGKKVTFVFHLNNENKKQVLINGEEIATKREENRYREGGFVLESGELSSKLKAENLIDIYC